MERRIEGAKQACLQLRLCVVQPFQEDAGCRTSRSATTPCHLPRLRIRGGAVENEERFGTPAVAMNKERNRRLPTARLAHYEDRVVGDGRPKRRRQPVPCPCA